MFPKYVIQATPIHIVGRKIDEVATFEIGGREGFLARKRMPLGHNADLLASTDAGGFPTREAEISFYHAEIVMMRRNTGGSHRIAECVEAQAYGFVLPEKV